MSSVFPSLHESLQGVLARQPDWTELRTVQEESVRTVCSGSDALIIAPTAGGKSEAALIPVMDDLLKHGRPGVACLYVSPLKALINDQEERFRKFCLPASLSVMKWHGDVPRGQRSWKDHESPHFLMITPESLEVLLQERDLVPDLRQVRYIIVDELHAFTESERGVHLKVLLHRMDLLAERKIQRIGLSATVGNPQAVLDWFSDRRHAAEIVQVPAPPREKQFLFIVTQEDEERITALIRIVSGKKALVFVSSRSGAERLAALCAGRIPNLQIHHSSISPATRRQAEEAFASPDGACIICTSTLELGIDIGDLDVVVQMGPPESVSSFLQRMGRSGRRGKPAYVAWILDNPLELLCSAAIIECAMQGRVEDLQPMTRPYNVLLQQILLRLHTNPRTTRRDLVSYLGSAPVFGKIRSGTLERLLDHLVTQEYITTDGVMIMPGPEAERVFGRSNGRDLFSVIPGGGEYRAVTPDGEVIGTLDACFVSSSGSGDVSLGGQSWTIAGRDEGHGMVIIVPGGGGASRVFWTGSGEGAGYSPLICRTVQALCSRGGSKLPLGEHERELLQLAMDRFPAGIGAEGLYIVSRERGNEPVTLISMNGSRFNRVLALLLRHRLGGKTQVRFDDFRLVIDGAGKEDAERRIVGAVREIRHMDSAALAGFLPLPAPEGWKFGRAIPPPLFREMICADHYHGGDFLRVLGATGVSRIAPEKDLR